MGGARRRPPVVFQLSCPEKRPGFSTGCDLQRARADFGKGFDLVGVSAPGLSRRDFAIRRGRELKFRYGGVMPAF